MLMVSVGWMYVAGTASRTKRAPLVAEGGLNLGIFISPWPELGRLNQPILMKASHHNSPNKGSVSDA